MSRAEYLDGGGCRSAKNDCNASVSLLLHCSFNKAGSTLSGSCRGFPSGFLGSFRLESSSRGFANNTTEYRRSSNAFVIRNRVFLAIKKIFQEYRK